MGGIDRSSIVIEMKVGVEKEYKDAKLISYENEKHNKKNKGTTLHAVSRNKILSLLDYRQRRR